MHLFQKEEIKKEKSKYQMAKALKYCTGILQYKSGYLHQIVVL